MGIIIYCDESCARGDKFSDFYGSLLTKSTVFDAVQTRLQDARAELGLLGEVKWEKISLAYKDKYIKLMEVFFDIVKAGDVKVRIMFLQNRNKRSSNLTRYQKENSYFILYYHFLKHAFGLQYHDVPLNERVFVELKLDQLPDAPDKVHLFKRYLSHLQHQPSFRQARITFDIEGMTEIRSHDHVLLQCLDVVLGSMQFKLNEKNRYIAPGKRRRGQRTKAKEEVYKYILQRIQGIYPRFNIGASTGMSGSYRNRWHHPYRHWSFRSRSEEPVREAA